MKRSKYGSKKITKDGITFDSLAEACYYDILKDKKERGEILGFELQPVFTLLESFKKDGKTNRAITYKADFSVTWRDGRHEVIDIKGFETTDFKIKKKLFDFRYQSLKLVLLAECPKKFGGGFILLEDLKKLRAKEKRELKKLKGLK